MSITPGNSFLTECEDHLKASLEASATFAAMTGKVYIDEFPNPNDDTLDEYTVVEFDNLFPAALIYEPEEGGLEFNHVCDGGPYGYLHSIRLNVEIQKERGTASTQEESRLFKNDVCNILDELLAQSGTNGKFSITRAAKTQNQWLEPDMVSNVQRMAVVIELEYSAGEF